MEENQPYVTKQGLIGVAIIVLALVGGCFYWLNLNRALSPDVVIPTVIGIPFLLCVIFFTLSRMNKIRPTLVLIKTECKSVANYGKIAMFIGAMSLSSRSWLDGIVWVYLGWGLISRKKWARILFMVVAGITALSIAVQILNPVYYRMAVEKLASKAKVNHTMVLVFFLIVRGIYLFFCISGIVYLNRPKVREFFNSLQKRGEI